MGEEWMSNYIARDVMMVAWTKQGDERRDGESKRLADKGHRC